MVDNFELWQKTVKEAISRYAKSQPKEVREDYEQECLIHILDLKDSIDRIYVEQGGDSARNYVYAVCHHKIVRLLTENNKRCSREISINDSSVTGELEDYSRREVLDLGISEEELDEAVKQLPRVEQHIIRSIYFKGISERELALSLNRPKTWIHEMKKSAIMQLREHLV